MDLDRGKSPAHLLYVRDMLEQLKVVSCAKPGSVLLYLLDMAHLEVANQIAGVLTENAEHGDTRRPDRAT